MGKVLAVLFILLAVLAALAFSVGYLYDELRPSEPVELTSDIDNSGPVEIIDYGDVPVFSERLRFSHNRISYFIADECSNTRGTSMREAFDIFEEKMELITFYEINEDELADISVGCSEEFIELGENLFAAGEGGPVNITNTSNFKTIQKGKIFLYEDQKCERPVVELHELLHVFGFDHTPDPTNIMFNISRCNQGITEDMKDLIDELYSIKPLPDARISELTVIRRGKYLDFNITVLNEGLQPIPDINLTLVSGEKVIDSISLGAIGIGYGRTLRATSLNLPSRNIETIDFILDYYHLVEELNENNNIVQTSVATS